MTLFVDSGYLIALEGTRDAHHDRARRHWHEVRSSTTRLVTTTFVLDEVVTHFNNSDLHEKAVRLGRQLLSSVAIRTVHVDEPLLTTSLDYLARRPDKRYSLTDCVSFVLMAQLGITHALTFDAHFEQAGFVRLPLQSR